MPRERLTIASSLTSKGFRSDPTGNHHRYWLYLGETKQSVFTKISHGSGYKTIGDELLSKMARQLKLTKMQFLRLVDCTMSEQEYVDCLRANSVELKD